MSNLNYEPRGDRVIVKRLPLPQPKPGDVFLPASQQKPLNEGTVIAVGPWVEDIGRVITPLLRVSPPPAPLKARQQSNDRPKHLFSGSRNADPMTA